MTGAPMPFSDPGLGPSPDHPPENVDYRALYLAEIDRLRNMTKEQENAGPDWYRMMTMRLRMGMAGLPPFSLGPVESLVGQPQTHQHLQHEALDDGGIMEEEDEE